MPWVENFQHLFKASASTEQPLISGGATLRGDMVFTGDGSIAGTIEGSLESTYHITIEEEARVTGSCSAGNLHASGRIEGDLHSREHIRLSPASYIRGSLHAATLEITPDADFEGALNIGPGRSE
ncbi:MAG: polymer-forming cytoskeletal protein [Verrucomicrobiota bacterium]